MALYTPVLYFLTQGVLFNCVVVSYPGRLRRKRLHDRSAAGRDANAERVGEGATRLVSSRRGWTSLRDHV